MNRLLFLIALLCALAVAAPLQAQNQDDLPVQLDLAMLANADYQLSLKNTDAAGVAINITGYQYAAQFRSGPAPTGTLFATYSASIVSAPAGTFRLTLSKAQTLALSGKSGAWDLLQIDASGKCTYLRRGKVTVHPTTTRLP